MRWTRPLGWASLASTPLLAVLSAGIAAPAMAAQDQATRRAEPVAPAIERDSIPGTLVTFEMVRLPGGVVEVPGADGPRRIEVQPVWIGRTELTWDAYDAFALGEDATDDLPDGADAVARPSRPYGAPDYGWGHSGYPAMSVTRAAAEAFCEWLSAVTGHTYRLPTEAEWLHAAELGLGGVPVGEARLDSIAWHGGNAGGTTHPVAARQPDALGLHDLLGNVAEWVVTADGERATRGGSFRDPPSVVAAAVRATQAAAWTERDPQLPPSRWWLSDAPFVGFRIVREP